MRDGRSSLSLPSQSIVAVAGVSRFGGMRRSLIASRMLPRELPQRVLDRKTGRPEGQQRGREAARPARAHQRAQDQAAVVGGGTQLVPDLHLVHPARRPSREPSPCPSREPSRGDCRPSRTGERRCVRPLRRVVAARLCARRWSRGRGCHRRPFCASRACRACGVRRGPRASSQISIGFTDLDRQPVANLGQARVSGRRPCDSDKPL